MFVGKILENGNSAFESRDGKTIEEVRVLKSNGEIGLAFKFEGFSILISSDAIDNVAELYRKSEELTMDELASYIFKNIYN